MKVETLKPAIRRTPFERFRAAAINPWTILGCVVAGAAFGAKFPAFSPPLAGLGSIYIDFQRMIVLPFMLASIVFSLQHLLKDGGAAQIIWRVFLVFVIFSAAAATFAALGGAMADFGSSIGEEARASLGDIVSANDDHNNMNMLLLTPEAPLRRETLMEFLSTLVPSNIFSALANGEVLRVLVFALLFGAAVSSVPSTISGALTQSLETVYRACQVLTRWITLPLPFALFAISAGEAGAHGVEAIMAMRMFVLWYFLATVFFLAASVAIISFRSGRSARSVSVAMRETFGLGVATNNSTVCMPAMIDGLATHLGFRRTRVELVVPIVVALLRTGAITYFVFATFFVAALYNRPISPTEIIIIALTSVLAGITSSGATGVATLSLLTISTGPLGLPFEAAYVLFVTVDSLCSVFRTLITVISGAAAVSLICDRPPLSRAEAAAALEAYAPSSDDPVVASSA